MVPWCTLHNQEPKWEKGENCCATEDGPSFNPERFDLLKIILKQHNMLPTNELQNPFYTTFGTCFAANILVGETMAHSVRYLRLLLHQPKEDVPKFKV